MRALVVIMAAICMALLMLSPDPARGAEPGREVERLQRWLWPHRRRAAPLPPQRPPEPQPPPVVVLPDPPPVVALPPRPPVERWRAPARSRAARPARVDDGGPDMPYPCWIVRAHAAGKSRAELEAMGRANGITLSAKQRRQAAACLAGK